MGLLRHINEACEQNNTALVAQLAQRFPEKKKWWHIKNNNQHIGQALAACCEYNNAVIFNHLKPILRQHVQDGLHIKKSFVPGKPHPLSLLAYMALLSLIKHDNDALLKDLLEVCPFAHEDLVQGVQNIIASKHTNFQPLLNTFIPYIGEMWINTTSTQFLWHACSYNNFEMIDFLYNSDLAGKIIHEQHIGSLSAYSEGFMYLHSKHTAEQQCQTILQAVRQNAPSKTPRKM